MRHLMTDAYRGDAARAAKSARVLFVVEKYIIRADL